MTEVAHQIPVVGEPTLEAVAIGPLESKHLLTKNYQSVAQTVRLTGTHYHVAIANGLGWMFDGMDGAILALVTPGIMATFGLSLVDFNNGKQLVAILSIVGVYLWPWLADRFGRRNILAINIALFSVALPFLALSPDWTWFLIIYLVVSIALAGEWAIGSMLVAETWPARLRAIVISFDRSGWTLGAGVAGLMTTYIYAVYGWRWVYIVPCVIAALAVYVRFLCPESPYWVRTKDRKNRIKEASAKGEQISAEDVGWMNKAEKVGMRQLFGPDLLKNTVLASFVATCVSLQWSTVGQWMPLFVYQERGWSTAEFGIFYFWWGLLGTTGYWLAGWISDRFGRKLGFTIISAEAAIFIILWTLATDKTLMWIFGILFVFGLAGVWGPATTYTAEMFPTRVRGQGNGVAWGIARIIGLGWPFLTVWIKGSTGSFTLAFLLIPILLLICVVGLWLFSPEVAGKELNEISI